ncbi:MAG: DUF4363 family protein [Clostridia bacterium]|nr:DUF4363 family protein [Clostridia bacterium]
MIKKWIIVVSILAALIVGCVIEHNYVNNTFDTMTQNLQVLKVSLEQNKDNIDLPEIEEYLKFLHEDFHQKEKVLKALIWHTGLKDVEVGISRIIAYAENNNFVEAMVETNSLIDYCSHYSQDFKITLENIF